jgi:hypothetical protein
LCLILDGFVYDRERVVVSKDGSNEQHIGDQERSADSVARTTVSPPRSEDVGQDGVKSPSLSSRSYLKSASISASKCVVVSNKHPEVNAEPPEFFWWQVGKVAHMCTVNIFFPDTFRTSNIEKGCVNRTCSIDLLHASCTFLLFTLEIR